MKKLITLYLALAPLFAWSQQPPGTDIYVVSLKDGVPVGSIVNRTNRAGYDNQPHFSSDSQSILFTSQHGEQTDIYTIGVASGEAVQVTDTQTLSEYSPTPRPGTDAITVVRVEKDGTQRIWQFEADGRADVLTEPDLQPVGYFDWYSENRFAAFVLGEPHRLVVKTVGQPPETVFEDIGRTVRKLPDGRIGFIAKTSEGWEIRAVDSEGISETLAPTLEAVEDFAVTPDGTLLMGNESALYTWNGQWTQVADWSDRSIDTITRLMVSPDGRYLALVANDGVDER